MGRRLCPWVTVRRHSRRTCRTNAYICMREQTLQSTLYPHACVTCGFATPLTPLPALQATLTRTETPHRMVSKVAAEETTVTMEMGEPICAPALCRPAAESCAAQHRLWLRFCAGVAHVHGIGKKHIQHHEAKILPVWRRTKKSRATCTSRI